MRNYLTAGHISRHICRFLFLFLLMLSMYSCGSGGSDGKSGQTQAPTTPLDLTAQAVSASEIRLQWKASSSDSGIDSYEIYEKGKTEPVAKVASTELSVNITELEPSTRHCYYVVALDKDKYRSEKTSEVCALTVAGIPSVPAGLSASGNAAARQASLSWAASTDDIGVTGYNVYRNGSLLTTVPDASFTDSGLQLNTNYIYSVSAYDADGNESGRSTETTVNLYLPPPVPALTATGNSAARQVNLSWSVSTGSDVVAAYRVYRDGDLITTVADASFPDSGLDLSRNYCYRVSSVDAVGNESDKSNESCVTLGDTEKPSVPSGLTKTGENLPARQATLSWTASTDNIGVTGYRVYRDGNMVTAVTGTSFTDSSLQPGTNYIYSVSAYDAGGNESDRSDSLTVKLEDKEPPSVPSGLTFTTDVNARKATLSWSPSTDNVGVKGYKVYRDGSSTPLTTVTGTSFTDSGLELEKDYRYTVSAYDEAGNESAKSGALTVRLGDTEKPTVPDDFKAEGSPGKLEVNLSWTASTDNVGVTGYRVYRDDELIETVTGTSWKDRNVRPSTDYSYKVSAIDAAGNESEKSTDSLRLPPMPPTNLGATPDLDENVIRLLWSAPAESNGIKEYKIYRDGNFLTTSSEASYIDKDNIIVTNRYCYKVSTVDMSGSESEKSSEACSSIDDPQPPTAPKNLSVKAVSTSEIEIQWAPATDNVSVLKYIIYKSTNNGNTWSELKEAPHGEGVESYTFNDINLDDDTEYCYKVSAVDQAGNESVDNPSDCARTLIYDPQRPTPPTGLNATAVSASEIKLEWGPATDNVGVKEYHISRNNGSGWSPIKTVPHSEAVSVYSYSDINLSASTEYSYRISAVDAAGNESDNNPSVSATTLPEKDTIPPSPAPILGDLAYYGNPDEGIGLSWTPSSDNVGVAGYTIIRSIDGAVSATFTVEGNHTTFTDAPINASGNYCYTVTAFDAAGNKSAASGSECITIDLEPPTKPLNLSVDEDGLIYIIWNASTDNIGIDRYDIYRSDSTGSAPVLVGTVPYHDDDYYSSTDSISSTGTYYYYVTAVDTSGNKSEKSETIPITVDRTPPPKPKIKVSMLDWPLVEWEIAPMETGISYTIYRKIGSGDYEYADSKYDQYQWTDMWYDYPSVYCYKIVAIDGWGNSSESDEACVP